MRWSVGIQAEADRVLSREEVVELADAVAIYNGIATGVGSQLYGAQLVVEARSRAEAIEKATAQFTQAATQARLPPGPIVRAEAISEDEDEGALTRDGSVEDGAGYGGPEQGGPEQGGPEQGGPNDGSVAG